MEEFRSIEKSTMPWKVILHFTNKIYFINLSDEKRGLMTVEILSRIEKGMQSH